MAAAWNLTKDQHEKLVQLIRDDILVMRHELTPFYQRNLEIAEAYCCYRQLKTQGNEKDCNKADELALRLDLPVLFSQVLPLAGRLADVFTNNTPFWQVVGPSEFRDTYTKAEKIFDWWARVDSWRQDYLQSIVCGILFNTPALDVSWQPYDFRARNARNPDQGQTPAYLNSIRHADPFNLLYDPRNPAAERALYGDFAGWSEYWSRMYARRKLDLLERANMANYGAKKIDLSEPDKECVAWDYYNPRPELSMLMSYGRYQGDSDYASDGSYRHSRAFSSGAESRLDMFGRDYYRGRILATHLSMWLAPADIGMRDAPDAKRPQLFRVEIWNAQHVVYFAPANTLNGAHSICVGALFEDGLGSWAPTPAERMLPNQDAVNMIATGMMNDVLRSSDDRGFYLPAFFENPKAFAEDKNPTGKYAIKSEMLEQLRHLSEVYHRVPYDDSASTQKMQTLAIWMGQARELTFGQNWSRRGEHRPGNRTLGEFTAVDTNADLQVLPLYTTFEDSVGRHVKNLSMEHLLAYAEEIGLDEQFSDDLQIDAQSLRSANAQIQLVSGQDVAARHLNPAELTELLQSLLQYPQAAQAFGINPQELFRSTMFARGVRNVDAWLQKPLPPDEGVLPQ